MLLHGRGADELDLVPLLDLLDPEQRLVGLVPRGPLALPPGGAHWYAVREIGFPDPETFLADLRAGLGLARRRARGGRHRAGAHRPRRLLAGNGDVVRARARSRRARARPAILAMSGFIPTVDGFELDLESRAGLPVSISHGTYDPVIGVEFGRDARDRLEAAGADVTYREDPVAHQIAPGAVAQARAVLAGALLPGRSGAPVGSGAWPGRQRHSGSARCRPPRRSG